VSTHTVPTSCSTSSNVASGSEVGRSYSGPIPTEGGLPVTMLPADKACSFIEACRPLYYCAPFTGLNMFLKPQFLPCYLKHLLFFFILQSRTNFHATLEINSALYQTICLPRCWYGQKKLHPDYDVCSGCCRLLRKWGDIMEWCNNFAVLYITFFINDSSLRVCRRPCFDIRY
jgi:hypothetical protein